MRHQLDDERLKFYIGDVREYSGLHDALRGVDLVFHAAALKQVPSCEFYPMEAVRTNVLGAENVLSAAVANKVGRVVVLSTDKAVYPINAMGMSKAMMEKIAVAKSRLLTKKDTVICATRYGNVMASRGSVIPLFVGQIKAGQRITITDPKMTRFMMSLPESVDLVLHAYEHGGQGDIYVQKAPACTVRELAEALQVIFEKRVPVDVIGTRHGEKLYESLVSREEMARAEELEQYYRIPADDRDLNYSKYVSEGEPDVNLLQDFTSHNTVRLNQSQLIDLLMSLDYIKEELGSRPPVAAVA
jgi:UDP-glucose 4-epimerase